MLKWLILSSVSNKSKVYTHSTLHIITKDFSHYLCYQKPTQKVAVSILLVVLAISESIIIAEN